MFSHYLRYLTLTVMLLLIVPRVTCRDFNAVDELNSNFSVEKTADVTDNTSRPRRFAYEDHHEWSDDDSLEYYLDDNAQNEDLTLWDQIGLNWQKVAVRSLFFLVGLCMFILIGCCCCKICCRVCCHSLRQNCVPCGGFLDIISSYYEDPMYKRAKDMAELFGLKLDYATYQKIKDRYDLGADGPYNPLGLPHME